MYNTHDQAFNKVKGLVDQIEKDYANKKYVNDKIKNIDTSGLSLGDYVKKVDYDNDKKGFFKTNEWDTYISDYFKKADYISDRANLVEKHGYDIFVKSVNDDISKNKLLLVKILNLSNDNKKRLDSIKIVMVT